MATSISIVCPECGKEIKAPENVLGKKVRCKGCQATFVARKASAKAAPPKPAKAPPKPNPRSADDDEDEDPYKLVDVSLAPRCPDCANEIEEGDVICLTCGYNLRTRMKAKTRKIYDTTFGEHFLWLLPGIGCVLAILSLIGFDVWYLMKIDDLVPNPEESWYLVMWTSGGIKLWVVLMSIGLSWLAGKFAFKRLILHPKPPEVEKLK